MTVFLYLIPLLTCGVLYAISGAAYDWDIYALIVGSSMLLTGLIHWLMYRHRTSAKEYIGSFVYSIRHDDAWTEIQEYYEEIRDSKGNTRRVKRTRYIRHPEEWMFYTSIGSSEYISRNSYDYIRRLWGTPCHHDSIFGFNIVGGARYFQTYEYRDLLDCFPTDNPFENKTVFNTMIAITEKHRYTNKLRNSNSIFRFEEISRKEANELGLWEYPEIERFDMSPILGADVDSNIDQHFRLLNAYYGARYQIRFFIIFFDSATQGVEIAEKQRAYWKGGNKNEFVICLGISNNKVGWCHAFSWMDEPVLSVKLENYFHSNPDLDLMKLHSWLRWHLNDWKRKEFSDFNYINVNLSSLQYWIAFLITCAINVAAVYLVLNNAPKSNNSTDYYYQYPETTIDNTNQFEPTDTSTKTNSLYPWPSPSPQ